MTLILYITRMSDYPIQRLLVYPAYPGSTLITWDLHPNMKDPPPYDYQLQRCRTANPDDEWKDIGSTERDAVILVDNWLTDPNSVRSGFILDCFYRIVLTTSRGQYVSKPEGCFGQLHREEWKLANEILAKERLYFKRTAVPGVLLQVKRQGERCPYCMGTYDDGINNAHCAHCFGTGYLGGYHKPFQFQAWQVSPSQLQEIHYSENVASINMSVDRYQARATGIPEIYQNDIWVDLSTAQRFRVSGSKVIAQIRRVPLIRIIDMTLIPASEMVYQIPIGHDNYSPTVVPQEVSGCYYKTIDHDYPTKDDLRYITRNGDPVVGATILITKLPEKEGEEPIFVHKTTTNSEGRWETAYKAAIGKYKITFEKPGNYGTDSRTIEVTEDEVINPDNPAYKEEDHIEYQEQQSQKNADYFTPFNV